MERGEAVREGTTVAGVEGGLLGEQNANDGIRGHMGFRHHLYCGSDRERVNYRAASAP